MKNKLENIIKNFDPITLEETQKVSFQNRIDLKYPFPRIKLDGILEDLSDHYKVQIICATANLPYETIYFDTPLMNCYNDHHNGNFNRYKIRSRKYVKTGECFDEIKMKTNRRKTIKFRTDRTNISNSIDSNFSKFIKKHSSVDEKKLAKTLSVNFHRMTLVCKDMNERVTIDTGLKLFNHNAERSFNDLTIVEIKRNKSSGLSYIEKILRNSQIYQFGISKYMLGVSLLRDDVKTNLIKPKWYKLRKIGCLSF